MHALAGEEMTARLEVSTTAHLEEQVRRGTRAGTLLP
jgi:hypothetical protein